RVGSVGDSRGPGRLAGGRSRRLRGLAGARFRWIGGGRFIRNGWQPLGQNIGCSDRAGFELCWLLFDQLGNDQHLLKLAEVRGWPDTNGQKQIGTVTDL